MSRCFPFPPPGYERKNTKSKVSDEASLIESIKKEQAKAEKESRKEKKREKKERKKKEKEEKLRLNGEVEKKSHSHKDKGVSADNKYMDYGKQKQYENEQLERSGLSEEHEPPSSVPTLCDSSDSTQNSGKRKKPSSPVEGHNQSECFSINRKRVCVPTHGTKALPVYNEGTMLRIRLPLVRQKDPEEQQPSKKLRIMTDIVPSISTKQSSSVSAVRTSVPAQASSSETRVAAPPAPVASIKQSRLIFGRPKVPAEVCSEPITTVQSIKQSSCISGRIDKAVFQERSESGAGASVGPSSSMKQPISTSEPTPIIADPTKMSPSEISSLHSKHLRHLLENWVPPSVSPLDSSDFDDQDWLFAKRPSKVAAAAVSCHESTIVSTWPPRAFYMPEIDMYALPYTVPF